MSVNHKTWSDFTWKPKVVAWDLWGTWLKSAVPGEDQPGQPVEPPLSVARCALRLDVDNDPALRQKFIDYCNTTNIRDPREFLRDAARKFNTTVPADALDIMHDVLEVERDNCALYGDVEPTVRAVQKAGVRQGVGSNIWKFPCDHIFDAPNCDVDKLLPSLGLGTLVEHLILSCEVGVCKPDPTFFLKIAERFGVEPEDVLFVGDSVTSDIMGALAVGMRAALIDRKRRIDPDLLDQLQSEGVLYLTSLVQLLPALGIEPTRS